MLLATAYCLSRVSSAQRANAPTARPRASAALTVSRGMPLLAATIGILFE